MNRHLALLGALFLACGAPASYAVSNTAPIEVTQNSVTSVIKGTVVDEDGNPITGASIAEIGTTRGTVTDIDGNFSLNVRPGAELNVTFLGYKTVRTVAKDGMRIAMQSDNALLDEVVVVGYGQQKKVNLTGSVANIDMDKQMNSRPQQNVAKALQGAVPGLSIINANGGVDASPTVRIRGLVGTLSNGQVSSPLIIVDGVPVDDMSMINSNDIASISVLKDAASSSIYGSRAAFGVILITTKQAKKGDRITINYNGHLAWDQATYLPDFPDVPTQLKAAMEAKARKGSGAIELFGMYFDQLLPYAEKWKEQNSGKKGYSVMRPFKSMDDVGDYYFKDGQPLYYADYDIQKIWYNNAAPSQSHNVSLSGSSGKTRFYTSFGYDDREDIMKFNPAKLHRYNLTANLQTDVNDWLTVGTRINWARRHIQRQDTWGNIYQFLWRWGSFFIPSGIMKAEDGTEYDYRIIAMQKQAASRTTVHDILRMTGFAQARITKGLTFNADYTYETHNSNFSSSDNSVYAMNWLGTTPQYIVGTSKTSAVRWNTKANKWTANAYFDFSKTWQDAHNLNVMVGVNGEEYSSDYFYAKRNQLYDQNYPELNLAYGEMKDATINSSTGDRASAGYFGRINYDYKGIYLLELNGRYDGSSKFPAGSKWAFFPSASFGYRFSEEAYWNDLRDIVSNGKFRLSYGEIGNENIGDNMFISTIDVVPIGSLSYLDKNGNKLNQFYLPSWVSSALTWERINTIDAGVDLGFLNDEFSLTFDWFQRTTKDMLGPGNALPPTVGADTPLTNSGELRTRGWELFLSWRRQFNKDFGLYANFNIGDSKAVITKWNTTTTLINYRRPGMVWGDIWGFETERYFTEDDFDGKNADGSWKYKKGVADQTGLQSNGFVYGPGDIKFKDLDGDGKIDGGEATDEDHGDLRVIGNSLPRYEYSFHLGGNYKGFDLDLFFQGVGKRDTWTQSAFAFPEMREPDLAIFANQTKYNVYDPEHNNVNISESNDFPCLWPGNEYSGTVSGIGPGCHNYYPQTKYLVNMAYLRLKNVTLGYTMPSTISGKIFVQTLRLYVSVDNACLLYKGNGDLPLDPEINDGDSDWGYGTWGRTTPITRTWSVGLQLTF